MEELLRAQWQSAAGTGRRAGDHLQRLLARYREPHRHYHTVVHLAAVLGVAQELLGPVAVADPAAVRLALFFHDAVYDPRSPDNEADSAALARASLAELGCDAGRAQRVAELVLATRHDAAPDDAGDRFGGPTAATADLDMAVVLDADLEVLSADPARYAAYVAGVRAEYAHVDEAAWRAGRGAVVRSLLAAPSVYRTTPMRHREHRARANLGAELARLGSA